MPPYDRPWQDPPIDHLAALLLTGPAPSVGAYTPERVTLTLSGTDRLADHVVYLHEMHHRGLNDSTAWGAALQLFADLPEPHRACFVPLLDACRLPHEAYATYASVNIAAARHENAAAVLDHYPDYIPLHTGLERMVSPAGGPHRRYLLATALARLSMQTPVLDVLNATEDFILLPSALRAIDTPDGRWRWLLRQTNALTRSAAQAADAALASDAALLAMDDGAHDEIAADVHDSAWARWEQTAYATLADALAAAGAAPLTFNGHMPATAMAVERALQIDPSLRMRAARVTDPAPDDYALAGSAIERVRLTLADPPYPGKLAAIEAQHLVDVVDDRCRIAGVPGLVLSARLPSRLATGYVFGGKDEAALATRSDPLVAARVLDEEGVAHLTIETPEMLLDVRERWGDRGPALSVIAASTLLDRAWQERWMPALRETGPLVFLIDIALERFVGGWAANGTPVRGGVIQVNDTGGGWWAIGLAASGSDDLWLALADEITVRLTLEQLQHKPGLDFANDTEHLRSWSEVLPVAITHVLATESFLDLEGLDEETLARYRTE